MSKLGNVATVGLALVTAYGLGIISCVGWEVKMLAEAYVAIEKGKNENRVHVKSE